MAESLENHPDAAAVRWLKAASAQGHPRASKALSELGEKRRPRAATRADSAESSRWYRLAETQCEIIIETALREGRMIDFHVSIELLPLCLLWQPKPFGPDVDIASLPTKAERLERQATERWFSIHMDDLLWG